MSPTLPDQWGACSAAGAGVADAKVGTTSSETFIGECFVISGHRLSAGNNLADFSCIAAVGYNQAR